MKYWLRVLILLITVGICSFLKLQFPLLPMLGISSGLSFLIGYYTKKIK